jgi:PAS domain S-box-containing protein
MTEESSLRAREAAPPQSTPLALEELRQELNAQRAELDRTRRELEEARRQLGERQALEEALQENEERFRVVTQSAADAIITIDSRGQILFWNRAAESMFGYPADQIVGQPLSLIIPERFHASHQAAMERVVTSGEARIIGKTVEMIGLHQAGHEFPIELSLSTWTAQQETFFTGIVRDITERLQVQEQLREKNRFITDVFESLGHPFYVVDAHDYSIKMANRAARASELPANVTCHALLHGRGSPCGMHGEECPLDQIRRTKKPTVVEHSHFDREGRQRWYEVRGYPVLDKEGEVAQIIEYTLDITDRKEAEEALHWAYEELEIRVQDRTADLAAANEALQRVAFENAELYEAEARARKLAETLSAASLALTQTLDLDTTLYTLLDLLGQVVPYDRSQVMLPHDEHRFVVRATGGSDAVVDPEGIIGTMVEIAGNPHLVELTTAQASLVIPDTREYPGWTGCPGDGKVLSWLGLSLVAGNRVIGICGLHKAEPGFYNEQHVQLAEALAAQAAVAIQNAWLFQQVRAGRERLRALSRRLVEVQESERRYIARELHDEAGQALTSLMVGLRLLERQAHRREAVIAGVEELVQMVDRVIDNLHRLSMHLRPASLEHLGLVAALRQYAESISDQHGLTLQFETVGLTERLPSDMEASLHRIVQEALTNVVRHARASRVDVLLKQRGDNLIVLVEDNGVGFDVAAAEQSERLGIFGMRERTEMLGGTLTVESSPGAGTTLLLEIPYDSTDPDRR